VDHLFAEIAGAILWFNPIIYLVKKSLYHIHEFEVDSKLTQHFEVKSYAELLLKLATSNELILKNGFSGIGIKSRIEMLFKNRSAGSTRLRYFLLIPLLCILTYAFTIKKGDANHTLPDGFVLIIDAAHGGTDAGGISKTGIQEKNITLQMATILQSLAIQKGISTVLTRTKDEFVPIRERLQVKGSIVISLHMKAGTKEEDVTGFEVGYFGGNAQSSKSQKLAEITQKYLGTISEMYTSLNFLNANPLILRENPAPGILVEMGDVNHKSDIQYMLDKRKQMELAEQIIKAIQAYVPR
jgi:N-acetylmuramoyl-L-alanine amidase